MLQAALLTRMPFARLGGPNGERLARAAFAVLVKFSQNTQTFMQLSVKLKFMQVEEQGEQKIRKLVQEMRAINDHDFVTLLKQWE